MNEPVFKNSMFSDDKSYKISIHSWVCIQNATTGYKRGPYLILVNYNQNTFSIAWELESTDVTFLHIKEH